MSELFFPTVTLSYNTLVGKSEGKRSLGRPRFKWDNIKVVLKKDSVRLRIELISVRILVPSRESLPIYNVIHKTLVVNYDLS
jgi:hypothetical protein